MTEFHLYRTQNDVKGSDVDASCNCVMREASSCETIKDAPPTPPVNVMDNITPANIDPKELDLPDGFTSADPNATGGGSAGGGKSETQGKEEQKQAILQQALTPDALARLRRIKLVKADKAAAVENQIVSMAMQGRLPGQVNEGKLIEMLEGIGAKKSSAANKISIQRKKYAFDSDDDDDNDDDLM